LLLDLPTKNNSKVLNLNADRTAWRVARCASKLNRQLGKAPRLAVVLGSGFHHLAELEVLSGEIHYADLPGFPRPSVAGHSGRLILGRLNGLELLLCCGRGHYYEGHEMSTATFPVRVLAEWGVKDLVVTNAAGGISPKFSPGDFMLISDHINFTGVNPLRGLPAGDGRCFVDLSQAYSERLAGIFRKAAKRARSGLREGVYIGVSGPSYETPAEIRAFRKWGADAVGMSTIPEVLMARYCGMEVAGLSCITNAAAGMGKGSLSHAEVLEVGERSARKAARLFDAFALEYQASGADESK
jgi:purine-nucleoside phosphorylase